MFQHVSQKKKNRKKNDNLMFVLGTSNSCHLIIDKIYFCHRPLTTKYLKIFANRCMDYKTIWRHYSRPGAEAVKNNDPEALQGFPDFPVWTFSSGIRFMAKMVHQLSALALLHKSRTFVIGGWGERITRSRVLWHRVLH